MDLSNLIPSKDGQTTLKERTLAFLALEVVDEMSESVIAISQKLARKYPGSPEGQSNILLNVARNVIATLYPRAMSKGSLVVKKEVLAFSEKKAQQTVGLYMTVSKRMSEPAITKAISSRDEQYFVQNFDSIFKNVPFSLDSIKTLLLSPRVEKDDKEVIWEFLQDLLKICVQGDYCYSKITWG